MLLTITKQGERPHPLLKLDYLYGRSHGTPQRTHRLLHHSDIFRLQTSLSLVHTLHSPRSYLQDQPGWFLNKTLPSHLGQLKILPLLNSRQYQHLEVFFFIINCFLLLNIYSHLGYFEFSRICSRSYRAVVWGVWKENFVILPFPILMTHGCTLSNKSAQLQI